MRQHVRGLKRVLKRLVPHCAVGVLRRARAYVYGVQQRAFDRRFGVDTSGAMAAHDLGGDEETRKSASAYQPTPKAVFLKMLKALNLDHRRFTFVDIGSGKGAVLLYASEFLFKEIVGVEYSTKLHEIAEANIRTYATSGMKCHNLASVCIDAVRYRIPNGPVILYFHNPFQGDVMAKVLANIEASVSTHPRELVIMSYNPAVEEMLDGAEWLERVRTGWNHAVYRGRIRILAD